MAAGDQLAAAGRQDTEYMITYYFHTEEGCFFRKTAAQQASVCEIKLMSVEEFAAADRSYPHGKNLLRGMDPVQCCKIEIFRECLQGTMRITKGDREELRVLDFGFYLKEQELILLEGEALLKAVLDKMKDNSYGACSPKQLLLILFEMLIEEDVMYLQELEGYLAELEETLLQGEPPLFHETIMAYRKKISGIHAYYEQLVNMGDTMQANIHQELTTEECGAWKHYTGRVVRLHNQVEALRDYLIQIRELHESQVAVRQNRIVSLLTVVTTIFLPLTLIAGWYGMNFPHMPELTWRYSYPVTIAVSLGLTVAEIFYFKKRKML